MSSHRDRKFGYDGTWSVCLTLMTGASAIFVSIMLYEFVRMRDVIGELIFGFLSLGPLIFFRATLSRFPLYINDVEISASLFGITTKTIKWKDVQKIRRIRVYNLYGAVDLFEIFDNTHNIFCGFFVNVCGNIYFTQHIEGYRELLDCIHFYARQFQIPLVALDSRIAATRISEGKGPYRWRRGLKQDAEIKVTEF